MFEGQDYSKYIRDFSVKRALAWCELDLYRMGSLSCHAFPSADSDRKEQEISGHCRRRQVTPVTSRNGIDVVDFSFSDCRMDYFQGGEYRASVDILLQDD